MLVKVQKWGNSQGIRFPKSLLDQLEIHVGDEVNISLEAGKIIVEPQRYKRGQVRIEQLVAEMPVDYVVEELDWGTPRGKEVW
jgi:antitoxin MazE